MSQYAKSYFHLRAQQEREKAMSSPHQWQRDQYMAMAAMFDRLSRDRAVPRY